MYTKEKIENWFVHVLFQLCRGKNRLDSAQKYVGSILCSNSALRKDLGAECKLGFISKKYGGRAYARY